VTARRIEVDDSPAGLPAFLRELASAIDEAGWPGSQQVAYLCCRGLPRAALVPVDVAQAAERHYRDEADMLAAEDDREAVARQAGCGEI